MRMRMSVVVASCVAIGLAGAPPVSAGQVQEQAKKTAKQVLGGLFGRPTPKDDDGASPSAEVQRAQEADRDNAAAVGTQIGAVVGTVAAPTEHKAAGAVLGAISGGAVGRAVGNTVANKRGAYADEYQEIDAAIAAAQQRLSGLRGDIEDMDARMATRDSEIEATKAGTRRTHEQRAQVALALQQVEVDRETTRAALDTATTEMGLLANEIARLNTLAKSAPDERPLAERRRALEARRADLIGVINRLNGMDARLTRQRQRLGT